MLRNSQLTHSPISWLHAGLFTPLVLEKEVKQTVLMHTFNSFEKLPIVEKRSRAVRSGAGYLPESQAGCFICSCSSVWQGANSNTAVLICFNVSWTFVCHFPIRHHPSLHQRRKSPRSPAFCAVVAQIAVLFSATYCCPVHVFDTGIQIWMPVQQLLPWAVHSLS